MSQGIGTAPRAGTLAGLLLACGSLALTGCGGAVGSVSGLVTYKDKPLTAGRVTFHAANNVVRGADIQPDGTYLVTEVPVGKAQITVETFRPPERNAPVQMDKSKMMPPDASSGEGKDKVAAKIRGGKYEKIPDKYKDPAQSGLSMDVVSGDQKHDLPLSD